MEPIPESQNTAPDTAVGSESPAGSAPLSVPVSDTADVASEGSTDVAPVAEPASEVAPETPPSTKPAPSPVPPTPEAQAVPAPVPVVVVKRNDVREYLVMALDKIRGKKAKKLAKIMDELAKTGSITNDQVEKLIHCSHASASRYLDILQAQGKIVAHGTVGHAVRYTKA